jgi:hypothetical protein
VRTKRALTNDTARIENVLFARPSLPPTNVSYRISGNPTIADEERELLVQIFVFKVTGEA